MRVHPLWVVACIVAGCGGGAREPALESSKRYMLPEAEGVSLGMTCSEVKTVRPAARDDSGTRTEATAGGDLLYVFRAGDNRSPSNRAAGTLAAVRMHPGLQAGDPQALSRWVQQPKPTGTR